jgi:hypothetical protein
MSSETEIANLASVSHLGCNRITNIGDNQTEAIVMQGSFAACRDAVLEDRAWSFATTREVWTPTADVPAFEFTYSYAIPTTVLKVLALVDGRGTQVRYKWRKEKDRILTSQETINVRYIERVTNTNLFSAGFVNCLAIYLAWYNCIALTESRTMKADLWSYYNNALADAASADGQQGSTDKTTSNQLLAVR